MSGRSIAGPWEACAIFDAPLWQADGVKARGAVSAAERGAEGRLQRARGISPFLVPGLVPTRSVSTPTARRVLSCCGCCLKAVWPRWGAVVTSLWSR